MSAAIELVDAGPLVAELRDWIARGNRIDQLPPGPARRARQILSGRQTAIRLDALDRLALALDRPWLVSELAPPAPGSPEAA